MSANSKLQCLAVGAGAIGKSISGHIFPKIGADFLYAEIDDAVIRDINHRGGYDLYSTSTGQSVDILPVRGIRAAHTEADEVLAFAQTADVYCTAIGAVNMPAFAPTLVKWLRARSGNKRLVLLLFENGTGLHELLEDAVCSAFGEIPAWFSIAHASIERITKKFTTEQGERNVMTEAFIPPILTRAGLEDTFIPHYPAYFTLVEEAEDYYYRKLYLNNIGHAVLGYLGSAKGYETTVQAVHDPEIAATLASVWKSTGEMVRRKFGFTQREIDEYFEGRLRCYKNTALADPLARLCRAPIRKLGREERIIGALELCYHDHIPIEPFFPLLYRAIHYTAPGEPQADKLQKLLQARGIEGVLREVCGISPEEALFPILVNGYQNVP